MGKEKACLWNWKPVLESGQHCIRPWLATQAHESLTPSGKARETCGKDRVWTEPWRTRGPMTSRCWMGEKSRRKEIPGKQRDLVCIQRQHGVVWLVWYVCWKAGVMVPWGRSIRAPCAMPVWHSKWRGLIRRMQSMAGGGEWWLMNYL